MDANIYYGIYLVGGKQFLFLSLIDPFFQSGLLEQKGSVPGAKLKTEVYMLLRVLSYLNSVPVYLDQPLQPLCFTLHSFLTPKEPLSPGLSFLQGSVYLSSSNSQPYLCFGLTEQTF
jgi:hypothetical protein